MINMNVNINVNFLYSIYLYISGSTVIACRGNEIFIIVIEGLPGRSVSVWIYFPF